MGQPLVAARNLARLGLRRAATLGRSLASCVERANKVTFRKGRSLWHGLRRAWEAIRDSAANTSKASFRSVRRPVRAALRRQARLTERWGFYKTEWGIERELETILTGDRTLVVGPWISEVGFEALYWVPFLHWVKAAFRVHPSRVVAVSRGGVASWYGGIADRYVEIWDHFDPADFAARNAERGVTKHYDRSPLDDDILDAVARRIGTRDFDVLHPGLMYKLFTLYWSGQRAMGFVDEHLYFNGVQAPALIDPALLPKEYVAVKFYAARSMPDTPAVRDYLRATVASLAERLPVVLLDTGLLLDDDHADYDFSTHGRVISARDWMTPRNNLGVQTQIIAGASAFVGTCGGIAWLAPRLGVNTAGLYVDAKWLNVHVPVAMRAYQRLGMGRFSTADLRAIDPLGALGSATVPLRSDVHRLSV